jgi:hypothetical protein
VTGEMEARKVEVSRQKLSGGLVFVTCYDPVTETYWMEKG